MNPQDHTGRHSSPWIEDAENADVIDDRTYVVDAPPVAAGAVAGIVHLPELRRHVPVLMVSAMGSGLAVAAVSAVGLMGLAGGVS